MKNGFQHTQEAIKQRGEVFTPTKLVSEMLDELPPEEFIVKTKTFLDNACGNGQFLFAVLERKMKNGSTHEEALKTIYGCELDFNNAEECRKRLLKGSVSPKLRAIVDHNIICADALDQNHVGWAEVGFYWDANNKPILPNDIENGEHALTWDEEFALESKQYCAALEKSGDENYRLLKSLWKK
jgi:SAM-dependent methyltransferase